MRKLLRDPRYTRDVVFIALRPWATGMIDYIRSVMRAHDIRHVQIVDRDVAAERDWAEGIDRSMFKKITRKFSDGVVLALSQEP